MAPKRKRSHSSESTTTTTNRVVTRSSGIKTRSSTRSKAPAISPAKSTARSSAKSKEKSSAKSKAKSSAKAPAKSSAKAPAKSPVPEKSPAVLPAEPDAEPPAKPAAKSSKKKAKTKAAAKTPPPAASVSPPLLYETKNIVIEHCLENNLFESRATELKAALEKYAGVVNVVINPKKPRKGCLEVRVEGGEIYYSLLDLKTPYAELSEMDMSEVVSDIAVKILSED